MFWISNVISWILTKASNKRLSSVLCGGTGISGIDVEGYKLMQYRKIRNCVTVWPSFAGRVDGNAKRSIQGTPLHRCGYREAGSDTCSKLKYYAAHPVPENFRTGQSHHQVDIDRKCAWKDHPPIETFDWMEGMVDEVRRLIEQGYRTSSSTGLEYKYLTLYVIGKLAYAEMFNGLEIAIHQFAKRQMTWFRGMERRGYDPLDESAELPMEEKDKL